MIENASTESSKNENPKEFGVSLISRVATLSDCESLSLLVNSSCRGESAGQGWVSTHTFIDGQRIDIQILTDIINDKTNIILVFFDPTDKILVGCVHLQHKPALKSVHLGMLTVRPDLQTRGYGKFILSMAESYAVNKWNIDYIDMTVLIQTPELIEYYKRRGYIETGQREPYPMHDNRY
ncbi:unnamed protein product, partial [Rotaria sordida]